MKTKTFHSNSFAETGKQFIENLNLLWTRLEKSSQADYEVIAEIFPDLLVMPGSYIHLHQAQHEGHGDVSYFYTQSFIDGKVNRDFISDLIIVQDTPENILNRIWQAYLLSNADAILPCFWHGGYNRCTFIFSEEDIMSIEYLQKRDWRIIAPLEQLLPQVTSIDKNTYQVVCHYWNEWQGMVRETQTFTLDGVTIRPARGKQEVLFPYHCGIWY